MSPKLKSIKRTDQVVKIWSEIANLKQGSSHPLSCLVGFVLLRQSWADSCQHLIYKELLPIPIWSTLWQPGLMFRRWRLEYAHNIHFSFDTRISVIWAQKRAHLWAPNVSTKHEEPNIPEKRPNRVSSRAKILAVAIVYPHDPIVCPLRPKSLLPRSVIAKKGL